MNSTPRLGWRTRLVPACMAAIDKRGALLVADDVGPAIWRVSAPP